VSLERRRTPGPDGASYSAAVAVDAGDARIIHVAGQTPRPPAGGRVPDDLAGQTELCFAQVEEVLRAHGAALSDVVSLTTYLTDLGDYASFAAVRAKVFGDELPSSAAVGVASLLGDVLVEVVAVAVVERPGE
jgi:2-iminobutanoate/2-iminopropanoate deaminase